MISIEKCKEILMHSNEKYTEEEIKEIRELVYKYGTIEYENYKSKQYESSSNLYKDVKRKAG